MKILIQIIWLTGAVCLASSLWTTAIASPSFVKVDYLTSVIQLLLEDQEGIGSQEEGFGEVIPGKLYSAAELAFWRARAQSGPHVVRGDAYGTSSTGSNPDLHIIRSSAQLFNNTADDAIVISGISRTDLINEGLTDQELAEISFSGECAVLDESNYDTFYAYYEFGRMDLARDAAFLELLEGTSAQTSRIKRILLEQAQQPCMDFTNRALFRNGPNNNAFWLYLEWLHKALKTYDYLDNGMFTIAEREIIDNWFKGAAEWAFYYTSIRHMGGVYELRSTNPIDSVIDLPNPSNPNNTGYWLNRPQYAASRIKYEGSSVFWPAGSLINNRHLGQLNFVVHAGVKYDVDEWKNEGAQIVKEYISFHFDDDGYYAELERAADSSSSVSMGYGIPVKAEHGLSYGANSLVNIAEIVHVLYLDGHENLYEYKSRAKINEDSGEIEVGSVEKSLEWVLLKFRQNFMLENSPAIYPLGLTESQKNTDTVVHFCRNTHREKVGGGRVVGRMYNPAAIINRHYKNPLIKQMYNASEDYGNLCEFVDTNIELRPGPHGISPGTLFQYSDADLDY